MSNQNSRSVFLRIMIVAALMVLVSCSGSQLIEPTAEETPCDDVDGTCIYVTFDGKNCTVAGPTDNHTGEFTAIFSNQYDGDARLEVSRVKDGKTLQDLEEVIKNEPQGYAEPWEVRMGFRGHVVDPGQTYTFTLNPRLKSIAGDYGVICIRDRPPWAAYGGGFTLVK